MFRYGYFVVIFSDKVSFKESLGKGNDVTVIPRFKWI